MGEKMVSGLFEDLINQIDKIQEVQQEEIIQQKIKESVIQEELDEMKLEISR